ncbi:UNVERIFIED_CONTAM: hypothetical protein Slati_0927200 [Sesamum latifolium]|uniref:Uncharacterized protein n=1 Tax=Sesamum latifolium TaxID=2727402 RepID=A0AAW2XVT1_9LAMI
MEIIENNTLNPQAPPPVFVAKARDRVLTSPSTSPSVEEWSVPIPLIELLSFHESEPLRVPSVTGPSLDYPRH